MAFLSEGALNLTGGCFCSAIRYTIDIPTIDSRPELPGALPTPIDKKSHTVPSRLPLINLDHCQSCRRACGSLLQCWFISQQRWVKFKLQARDEERAANYTEPFISSEAKAFTCADVAAPSDETIKSTYLGQYKSSPDTQRVFCARCGTGVTYCFTGDRGPDWKLGPLVDIAIGTLDQESLNQVRVDRHGWWEDGTDWIKKLVTDGDGGFLIRHPTGRVNSKVDK